MAAVKATYKLSLDSGRLGLFETDISNYLISFSTRFGMASPSQDSASPSQMTVLLNNKTQAFSKEIVSTYGAMLKIGTLVKLTATYASNTVPLYIGRIQEVREGQGEHDISASEGRKVTLVVGDDNNVLLDADKTRQLWVNQPIDQILWDLGQGILMYPYFDPDATDIATLGDGYTLADGLTLGGIGAVALDYDTARTELNWFGSELPEEGGISPLQIMNMLAKHEMGGLFYYNARTGRYQFRNRWWKWDSAGDCDSAFDFTSTTGYTVNVGRRKTSGGVGDTACIQAATISDSCVNVLYEYDSVSGITINTGSIGGSGAGAYLYNTGVAGVPCVVDASYNIDEFCEYTIFEGIFMRTPAGGFGGTGTVTIEFYRGTEPTAFETHVYTGLLVSPNVYYVASHTFATPITGIETLRVKAYATPAVSGGQFLQGYAEFQVDGDISSVVTYEYQADVEFEVDPACDLSEFSAYLKHTFGDSSHDFVVDLYKDAESTPFKTITQSAPNTSGSWIEVTDTFTAQNAFTIRGVFYTSGSTPGTLKIDDVSILGTSSANTLTEDEIMDVSASFGRDMVNHVRLHYQEHEVMYDNALVYQSTAVIEVEAGANEITLDYKPQTNDDKRVTVSSVNTPAVGVDIVANTLKDGSGTDVSDQLTVEIANNDTSVSLVINNPTNQTVYLTSVKLSGARLVTHKTDYVETEDTVSQGANTYKPLTEHYPLVNMADVQAYSDFIIRHYKDPSVLYESVEIIANQSAALMALALGKTIGQLVHVSNSWTGHDRDYFIIGEQHRYDHDSQIHHVRWMLEKDTTYSQFTIDVDSINDSGKYIAF